AYASKAMRTVRGILGCWRRAAGPQGSTFGIPVFVVADPLPVMSLVGALRPELFVTDRVASELTADEFELSLSHEAAHVRSNDNLKRLIMTWAPDLLGTSRLGRDLNDRWRAAIELAADAEAVGSSESRAVLLASALVKIARLRLAGLHLAAVPV